MSNSTKGAPRADASDAAPSAYATPGPMPVKPTPETAEGIAAGITEIRVILHAHTWGMEEIGDVLYALRRRVPLYVLAAFAAGAAIGAAGVWIGGAL